MTDVVFNSQNREQILQALVERMTAVMPVSGTVSLCGDHLQLHRFDQEKPCESTSIYKPLLSFMIRGTKRLRAGDSNIVYNPGELFINGVDIPAQFLVSGVSTAAPGFAVSILLDPSIIKDVMTQLPLLDQQELMNSAQSAHYDTATTDELVTLLRLVELYSKGVNYDFPYQLLLKELYYYVLSAKHGMSLRKLFTAGAQDFKIAKSVQYLREHYREDVDIEKLASLVFMAVPTFYKHFKQVTSLSPLQYIKRLRLYEAKRLMISENMTAAAAGYDVGYSSEQHFSRDYKKLFGRPPLQDVKESSFVDSANPFTDVPVVLNPDELTAASGMDAIAL